MDQFYGGEEEKQEEEEEQWHTIDVAATNVMSMIIPCFDKDFFVHPHIQMGKGRMTITVLRYVSRWNTIKALAAADKGDFFFKTGELKTGNNVDFYEVTKFKIDPMGSDLPRRYSIDGEPVQFAPLTVTMEQGALRMLSF